MHHISQNGFSALLAVGLASLIAHTSYQNTKGDQINSPTCISYADPVTQSLISSTENDTGDGSASRSGQLSPDVYNSQSLSVKWTAITRMMNSNECIRQAGNTVNEPENPAQATIRREVLQSHNKPCRTWRDTGPSLRKQSAKDTSQAGCWHVT